MARSFNGTSDCIKANAAAAFSEQSAYAVALWITGAATPNEKEFYSEGRVLNNNSFLLLRTGPNNGKASIVARNNAGGTSQINTINTASTVFDNTWHHFIFTQDASGNWQAYVDGAADSTAHGSYTPGVTTVDLLTIGADNRASTLQHFFPGSIAHLAIWHRQLSATEAASLGAGLLPSHLAPDHYWPLWGADSPELDIGTATHVAGTLTGTAVAAGSRAGLYPIGVAA